MDLPFHLRQLDGFDHSRTIPSNLYNFRRIVRVFGHAAAGYPDDEKGQTEKQKCKQDGHPGGVSYSPPDPHRLADERSGNHGHYWENIQ